MSDILLKNIGQIITWDSLQNKMIILADQDLLIRGALIHRVGSKLEAAHAEVIDCSAKVLTAGLIDAHTHPVFADTRQNEFELRIQGKSYLEIAAAGGGIRNSVRSLRLLSEDELFDRSLPRLKEFLTVGTTTLEAKSGYGLSFRDEIKSLNVIRRLNEVLPVDLIPTFLGAHEIPDEYQNDRARYIDILTQEMIPYIAENHLAEYCDVFADKGVYTRDEAEVILTAAKENGLKLRIHSDEFENLGATELAAELGASSADHLLVISDRGIDSLKQSGTVAVILPGTAFFLGKKDYAPARKMWDAGVTLALASDFNPGSSMTHNLQMIMSIACTQMKLTPLEAFQAVTINAARSLDRADRLGSVEPGKTADLALWDVDDFRLIPYWFGKNHLKLLIKQGQCIQR